MVIYEDTEKVINSTYEIAKKLYENTVLKRNTKILPIESGVLTVIGVLGQIQDTFKKLFLDNNEKCVITKLYEDNLELRSSINGWRSEQTVQILQAGKIEQNVQQIDNPFNFKDHKNNPKFPQ